MSAPSKKDLAAQLRGQIVNLRTSSPQSVLIHLLQQAVDALELPVEEGAIVVTKTEQGQIVAVTRQDEEGRILKVISESAAVERTDVISPADLFRALKPRNKAEVSALLTLAVGLAEKVEMSIDEMSAVLAAKRKATT